MATDWRRAILLAIELSEANPDDADWIDALRKAGLSEGEARVTVAMMPVAFGRAFLIELGMTRFAPTFRAYDEKGRPVVLSFGRQPVFREAAAMAMAASHHGAMDRSRFVALAMRGGEAKIVLHEKKSGQDIDAAEIVTAVGAPPDFFVGGRPWWKFYWR